jgi:hypothetical protein
MVDALFRSPSYRPLRDRRRMPPSPWGLQPGPGRPPRRRPHAADRSRAAEAQPEYQIPHQLPFSVVVLAKILPYEHPRMNPVHSRKHPDFLPTQVDLSKLTDDELDTFEKLARIVQGGAWPRPGSREAIESASRRPKYAIESTGDRASTRSRSSANVDHFPRSTISKPPEQGIGVGRARLRFAYPRRRGTRSAGDQLCIFYNGRFPNCR